MILNEPDCRSPSWQRTWAISNTARRSPCACLWSTCRRCGGGSLRL